MTETEQFFVRLPPRPTAGEALDEMNYASVPPDWSLAVSDIRDSTAAIAQGRHSDVNFAAAAMIAGLTNLCGPIPHQFGGDGAVALIPPGRDQEARRVLARTRAFAAREYRLDQRVGLVAVGALVERGVAVEVAKYQPTPVSAYAVFRGGGVSLLERSLKGRGDAELGARAAIPENLDDGEPPDLTGLSCRWSPIRPARGTIVSLVVSGANHARLRAELAQVVGIQRLNAVAIGAFRLRQEMLRLGPLMREISSHRGRDPWLLACVKVLKNYAIEVTMLQFGIKSRHFDPPRFIEELADGAVDFARTDDTLFMVFDCPGEKVAAVKAHLDAQSASGALRYGMSLSDHAVMTCLVSQADGKHVHFVDGGNGGYTRAANQIKARPA